MSTLKVPRDGYHIYIGSVKVAEVHFHPGVRTRWKCYLRLMRNDVSYKVLDFEGMGQALHHLHTLLQSPPPEGATIGRKRERQDQGHPPPV